MNLARDLHAAGLTAVLGGSHRSIRSQLRLANTLQARYAALLGPEELAQKTVTLRDLATSEQISLPVQGVIARLRQTK
jgi:histidyl-tRNA synthetase